MTRELTRLGRLALVAAFLAGLAAAAPAQTPTVPAGPTTDGLFNGDVVQRVDLKLNSRDWQALKLNFQDNTYYPADLTWNGITVRNVGIRSRGNGSRSGQKPGLRVDMDRYSTTQKFLGLKSIVLDNVWQDPSFMKEKIAMELFRRLGQPASREAFARLYVNNTFAGLYVIIESVDKDFLERNFDQDEGYLYEYNYTSEWNFTWLGSDYEPYAELFDPKTNESKSADKLYGPIVQMVRDVNEARDDMFEATLRRYLNPDDVIAHLALENAIADEDGILGGWGMNNFYLYRSVRTGQSRLIVWDQDQGFQDPQFPIDFGLGSTVLVRRTLELPHLWQLYLDTLMASADALGAPAPGADDPLAARTWIEAEVDQTYELIREAALNDPLKPWTDDDFEVAVDQARIFARLRAAYLRNEVSRLLDPSR